MLRVLRRVLLLAGFAAIVATITYQSVVASVRKRPGRPLVAIQHGEPGTVAIAASSSIDDQESQSTNPELQIVSEIARIRERLRQSEGAQDLPDTGTPEQFADSLRDVIAARTAKSQSPSDEIQTLPAGNANQDPGVADEKPAIPLNDPPLFSPSIRSTDAQPPPSVPPVATTPDGYPRYFNPTLPSAPDLTPPPNVYPRFPFVPTIHTRSDVVVALRQIGRQFDTLAADLEDQHEFDDAESLRQLVQTIRAEARRLEEK